MQHLKYATALWQRNRVTKKGSVLLLLSFGEKLTAAWRAAADTEYWLENGLGASGCGNYHYKAVQHFFWVSSHPDGNQGRTDHDDRVPDGRVLADNSAVDSLAEGGRVVIDVRHIHVHCRHRAQCRRAPILRLHHQVEVLAWLEIQSLKNGNHSFEAKEGMSTASKKINNATE